MDEVKLLFKKRQYKNCSARCIQILDSMREPTRAHPLYLTWMAFYAAASLEQISCPLHMNSGDKLSLLQQSLSYYEKAESYLQLAPYSMTSAVTQEVQQRSSSLPSSACLSTKQIFFPPKPTDSPSATLSSSRDTTVDSRLCNGKMTESCISSTGRDSSLNQPVASSSVPEDAGISTTLSSHPLARYRIHLAGMQTQLHFHINSVNKQITSLQEERKARRSNRPDQFAAFSAGGLDGIDIEALKKAELQARVERLRKAGWKRERFDVERYQKLCDQALAELD